MVVIPSRRIQIWRLIAVFTLFSSLPLVAFGQRFGGAEAQSAQRTTPPTPPPTAPASQGGQNRPAEFSLSWEWWKDEAARKSLKLSDMQVRSITRLYDDRARQMKPVWDELQTQLAEVEKMTRERIVDAAVYSIQVTRVEGLRTELNKTRSVMLYSIHKMLSPEQYEVLREIRDKRRSGRGGGPR